MDTMLVFRVPRAVSESIERAARAEQRSKSNMLLRIVTEWLDAHPVATVSEHRARKSNKRG